MIRKNLKKFSQKMTSIILGGVLISMITGCPPPNQPAGQSIKAAQKVTLSPISIVTVGKDGTLSPGSGYITLSWQNAPDPSIVKKIQIVRNDKNTPIFTGEGEKAKITSYKDTDDISAGKKYEYTIRFYDEKSQVLDYSTNSIEIPSYESIPGTTFITPSKDEESLSGGGELKPTFEWEKAKVDGVKIKEENILYYLSIRKKNDIGVGGRPLFAVLTKANKFKYGDKCFFDADKDIPSSLLKDDLISITGTESCKNCIPYNGLDIGTAYSLKVNVVYISPGLASNSFDLNKTKSFVMRDSDPITFYVK